MLFRSHLTRAFGPLPRYSFLVQFGLSQTRHPLQGTHKVSHLNIRHSFGFCTSASGASPTRKWKRRGLFAVTGLVTVGLVAGGLYKQRLSQNKSITSEEFHAIQKPHLDAVLPSNAEGLRKLGLTLFRYTTCPFCGKVKAFLDYHKIPYVAVEVDPMFKSQLKGHGYHKVPQLKLVSGDEQAILVDSDKIVEMLSDILGTETEADGIAEWRDWARERLVRYLVININRSVREAFAGYSYIDQFESIPTANKIFLKIVGAPVMYLVAQRVTKPRLLKMNQPSDGSAPPAILFDPKEDERKALFAEVDRWVTHGLAGNKFHGGATDPDLADLDVYGVMQSIRGHSLYHELIATNSGLATWLAAMDAVVTSAEAHVPA